MSFASLIKQHVDPILILTICPSKTSYPAWWLPHQSSMLVCLTIQSTFCIRNHKKGKGCSVQRFHRIFPNLSSWAFLSLCRKAAFCNSSSSTVFAVSTSLLHEIHFIKPWNWILEFGWINVKSFIVSRKEGGHKRGGWQMVCICNPLGQRSTLPSCQMAVASKSAFWASRIAAFRAAVSLLAIAWIDASAN